MNIIVVGLGSMGKRRIRLLQKYFNINNMIGIDLKKERRIFCEENFNIKTYGTLKEILGKKKLEVAFICTAPLSHFKLIDSCLDFGINVFSEINLVSNGYKHLIKKAKNNQCKLFLSSTPLYRKEIIYMIEKAKTEVDNLNYIYHVGQYLPDWHPWEQYKDFFIGEQQTNGCREIFGIELPWIIEAFGEIEKIVSVKSKNTKLKIEYNDNYIVTLFHKTGHKGVLCFDVISREAVRTLEIFGENIHLKWNGTPESLTTYDINAKKIIKINTYDKIEKDKNYSDVIIENAYIDEINSFFEYLKSNLLPKYSFEKDLKVLKILDEIEDASL